MSFSFSSFLNSTFFSFVVLVVVSVIVCDEAEVENVVVEEVEVVEEEEVVDVEEVVEVENVVRRIFSSSETFSS